MPNRRHNQLNTTMTFFFVSKRPQNHICTIALLFHTHQIIVVQLGFSLTEA
jgi:hypothetical protein